MKYIDKITPAEINEAVKQAYGKLTQEEFWDIRFAVADDNCICYKTHNSNCFYYYDTKKENFVYFALEKSINNIKGLYEVLYQLVCNGVPYISFNGRKGRYNIIRKIFYCVFDDIRYTKSPDDEYEYFTAYAAHPINVQRLLERINK